MNSKQSFHLAGVVISAATAIFMVNLDTTVVNIILPTLAATFNVNPVSVSQVNIAYLLALTALLLVFGRLCDFIGPEKIFISGYAVFTIGSALCAAARGVTDLTFYRFVQGAGGAMLFASCAVLVVKYIPKEMRGRAFGVNGLFAGIGFAMGSPVGGWLLQWHWRWVFLVNIPIGLVGIAISWYFLNDRRHERVEDKFDSAGAVWSCIALVGLIFFLQDLGRTGLSLHRTPVYLIIGSVALVLFLRHEKRAPCPLLDLELFKSLPLTAALFANFAYLMLLYGISIIFPFYFHNLRGMETAAIGGYMAIFPLVSIVISPVTGYLCDKIGTKIICVFAMAMFVVSTLIFTTFDASTPPPRIVGAFLLFGLAMALFCTAILALVMTYAEQGKAGVLSSVKAVIPNLGGMLGVSLFTILFSYGIKQSGQLIETAGVEILNKGFRHAMFLAVGTALAGLALTLCARQKNNYEN